VHNDGYDDQNYDYILRGDEIMNDRYIIKHKMGKVRCQFWLLLAEFACSQLL
jgi:hypothetical protein